MPESWDALPALDAGADNMANYLIIPQTRMIAVSRAYLRNAALTSG